LAPAFLATFSFQGGEIELAGRLDQLWGDG
jgi:hypothetical protein